MNTRYRDQIIRYVLDASPEENERLAVFIARIRDEKQGRTTREKGSPGMSPGGKNREGRFQGLARE
ncbi:MAG: hypothetical protein LBI94_01655 [Treponema sp.]|nr:hypothetical protein [Treponema sp.]